jgi:hypothetical protein
MTRVVACGLLWLFFGPNVLRVVAAALLREVAEVVPLSDPRAQLLEMRLSRRTGA